MFTKEDILENIARCVERPVHEIFVPGFDFSDYRLSYGVHCYDPSTVYFIAIYPAFCVNPKAMFHYNTLEAMLEELNGILEFVGTTRAHINERHVQTRDIIAALFSLSRGKESIELFQEQKDFMELGVKHFHLDNFYQDFIRAICGEFFTTGKMLCKPVKFSFLKLAEANNGK